MGMMRSSTHALATALLRRDEGPIRGITVGRVVVIWEGKSGDYMETISTDEFFGPEATDESENSNE